MVSYEEFKKNFLEQGKNTWNWREVYDDLVNETGTHGNLIRTYYKYKCEKK